MSELITIVSSSPLLIAYCKDNYGGKTVLGLSSIDKQQIAAKLH